jgi:hypothetical protein
MQMEAATKDEKMRLQKIGGGGGKYKQSSTFLVEINFNKFTV